MKLRAFSTLLILAVLGVFLVWPLAHVFHRAHLGDHREVPAGARLSPFHMGENDKGKRYIDVVSLYREARTINAHIEASRGNATKLAKAVDRLRSIITERGGDNV